MNYGIKIHPDLKMKNTACVLLPLAVFFLSATTSCHTSTLPSADMVPSPALTPTAAAASAPIEPAHLAPSPHRLVGRVIGIDPTRRFAIVELAATAPALEPDAELVARTDHLLETGRLRTTRQLRGRTLGTAVISGEPSLGDEVVLLAQ